MLFMFYKDEIASICSKDLLILDARGCSPKIVNIIFVGDVVIFEVTVRNCSRNSSKMDAK